MSGSARVFSGRVVLLDGERSVLGGGVLVVGGLVARVLGSEGAVRRAVGLGARLVDGGDGVLAAGMVNAHAHLELSGYRGEVPAGRDFPAWIEALLALRPLRSPRQRARDAERGARALLASGTTTVGDVDSTGAGLAGVLAADMRAVVYREVLDPLGESQRAASLARVARGLRRRVRVAEGISPHAPMTCSSELLAGAARVAVRRRLPSSVHWAETAEEDLFVRRGEGPFSRLLSSSPGCSGLEHLARGGFLGRRTSLVHANHPGRGELARAARRAAAIVHCPGTHAFFGRSPFPVARWRRAGAVLALGTDSLASNQALDMGREMGLLRDAAPSLSPGSVWDMATRGGARALGLERQVGRLTPGALADLALFGPAPAGRRGPVAAALEALTSGALPARGVWVAGRNPGIDFRRV